MIPFHSYDSPVEVGIIMHNDHLIPYLMRNVYMLNVVFMKSLILI